MLADSLGGGGGDSSQSAPVVLAVGVRFGPLACVVTARDRARLADVIAAARTDIPELPASRHVCVHLRSRDPDPARWTRVSSQVRLADLVSAAAVDARRQIELHVRIRTAARVRAARATSSLIAALRRAAAAEEDGGGGLDGAVRAALALHRDAPAFMVEHPREDVYATLARACDRPVLLPFGPKTADVFAERQRLASGAGGLRVPAALDAALRVWGWQVFYAFACLDLRADAHRAAAVFSRHLELARFVLGAPATRDHAWSPPPECAADVLTHLDAFLWDVCVRRATPLADPSDHLCLREVLGGLYMLTPPRAECAEVLGHALRALAISTDVAHCPDLEPWGSGAFGEDEGGACRDAHDAGRVLQAAFPLLSGARTTNQGPDWHELDDDQDDSEPRAAPPLPAPAIPEAAHAIELEMLYADSDDDDAQMASDLPPATVLFIARDNLLESSVCEVACIDARAFMHPRASLEVVFLDEGGQGHGVVRDWITAVFDAVAAPDLGLFVRAPGNAFALHPSPAAEVLHPRRAHDSAMAAWRPPFTWMELYAFVGRMWAIAMRLDVRVGYHFSDAAWRMLQGRGVGLAQLDQLEPDVARCCRAVLRAADDATALRAMGIPGFVAPHPLGDLRFVAEPASVELLPGGADLEVAPHNAALLVQLMADHYLGRWDLPAQAIACVREGMLWGAERRVHRRTVMRALADLPARAFNSAAGGTLSLRVAEWRACVDVVADPSVREPAAVAERFWEAVRVMDACTRRALARFWTGSCTLPPPRERERTRWQLHLSTSATLRLPSSHTCFRQLHLPTSHLPTPCAAVLHALLVAALRGHDGEIYDP